MGVGGGGGLPTSKRNFYDFRPYTCKYYFILCLYLQEVDECQGKLIVHDAYVLCEAILNSSLVSEKKNTHTVYI